VAGLLLTTEAAVVDKPEKKRHAHGHGHPHGHGGPGMPPGGMPPGMGGMGDMDF
jgi:hypothetical protein